MNKEDIQEEKKKILLLFDEFKKDGRQGIELSNAFRRIFYAMNDFDSDKHDANSDLYDYLLVALGKAKYSVDELDVKTNYNVANNIINRLKEGFSAEKILKECYVDENIKEFLSDTIMAESIDAVSFTVSYDPKNGVIVKFDN